MYERERERREEATRENFIPRYANRREGESGWEKGAIARGDCTIAPER